MKKEFATWKLQPLHSSEPAGHIVSRPNFDDSHWHTVTVPSSLVGNYVEVAQFDHPYYDENMKALPGYKHGRSVHFAFFRMPDGSPFRKPFWYRTNFTLGRYEKNDRFKLQINGINYRGTLWVNGKRVAGSDYLAGTYRRYTVDITYWLRENSTNTIALEITPQEPDELGMTFIDWSPVPPDDSAGIWQPVTLYSTGTISLSHPFISPRCNPTHDEVALSASVTVSNNSKEAIKTTLTCVLAGITCSQDVTLEPYEERVLSFSEEMYPELLLHSPKLWWPWDMGEQPLYSASFAAQLKGTVSHSIETTFGIRSITSKINEYGSRQFYINGKPLLIRGSAWSPDLLLQNTFKREKIDLAYLKQMRFNTVRLEGKLASDQFWDHCDREGILVLAGWPCCTHWEQWEKWKPDDYIVAKESLRSQLLRLRNHASFAAWFYGSDFPPIEPVERIYLSVLKGIMPQLVHISSAAAFDSTITGKSGVKMSGPYGYVPPSYWYNRSMPGHADSFNTECGPDASFPRFESLCRMITEESQRSVGSASWNHHAGLASFDDTELMNTIIESRYGVSRSELKPFLRAAQLASYEAWRGMYEAYNRNYPEGTGVIGWMLNGHWPSLIWQMYDYWFVPTGGFYGSRIACAPLHVQYSYDDNSIWVANNTQNNFKGTVSIELLSKTCEILNYDFSSLEVAAQERKPVGNITPPSEPLFFVLLKLRTHEDELVQRNIYWLTPEQEEFKTETVQTEWFYRPLTRGSDFSELLTIENTVLSATRTTTNITQEKLNITNTGSTMAVSVVIDAITPEGELLQPLLFSDNFLMILPHETITIDVDFALLSDVPPYSYRISGENVEEQWL